MKRNFRRKKNFIENFPIALQSRAGRGGRPPLATTTEDKGGGREVAPLKEKKTEIYRTNV